ncbi:hypothetical protein EV562_101782 [Streptomyces sp. BK208]|nr:hypothetical protein EV562_101782 [Streptomyces sp. BK208]
MSPYCQFEDVHHFIKFERIVASRTVRKVIPNDAQCICRCFY